MTDSKRFEPAVALHGSRTLRLEAAGGCRASPVGAATATRWRVAWCGRPPPAARWSAPAGRSAGAAGRRRRRWSWRRRSGGGGQQERAPDRDREHVAHQRRLVTRLGDQRRSAVRPVLDGEDGGGDDRDRGAEA